MGQAKRRRLTDTYPQAGDPIAAARRFWCGRDRVAAEDFVAPAGTLAVTIDVDGAAPSTVVFDASKVAEIEAEVRSLAGGFSYRPAVCSFAKMFVEADDTRLPGIGVAILWSAFNHPETGEAMRCAVSEALRQDGKAHITWHFSPQHGLAMGLADGFVDLEASLAEGLQGKVLVYTSRPSRREGAA